MPTKPIERTHLNQARATEELPPLRVGEGLERRQFLLGGLALIGGTGCGLLLHPERRGRTSGPLDGTVLIFDLLWLLPGLLPGIVCLAVDFASGGIYGGGTSTTITIGSDSTVSNGRLATVEIELDGAVVATSALAGERTARLTWHGEVDPVALRERGQVRVRGAEGQLAQASAGELLSSSVPARRAL